MRIWDINPGYLSRDLLLAEHRILHETVTLVTARKSVYGSQESMRWRGFGWADLLSSLPLVTRLKRMVKPRVVAGGLWRTRSSS